MEAPCHLVGAMYRQLSLPLSSLIAVHCDTSYHTCYLRKKHSEITKATRRSLRYEQIYACRLVFRLPNNTSLSELLPQTGGVPSQECTAATDLNEEALGELRHIYIYIPAKISVTYLLH